MHVLVHKRAAGTFTGEAGIHAPRLKAVTAELRRAPSAVRNAVRTSGDTFADRSRGAVLALGDVVRNLRGAVAHPENALVLEAVRKSRRFTENTALVKDVKVLDAFRDPSVVAGQAHAGGSVVTVLFRAGDTVFQAPFVVGRGGKLADAIPEPENEVPLEGAVREYALGLLRSMIGADPSGGAEVELRGEPTESAQELRRLLETRTPTVSAPVQQSSNSMLKFDFGEGKQFILKLNRKLAAL